MKIPSIRDLKIESNRVFLRVDLNVPIKDKKILQDYKILSILPTIDFIQKNGGKVILATHIGRPDAKEHTNFFDDELSTEILLPWFKDHGYKIHLERDLKKTELFSRQDFGQILLLENLRFFNGEQGNSQEREAFVVNLKNLADCFVNDAFGLIHRSDTSITLLPEKFACSDRAVGFLVEKELNELNKLKVNINQPFVLVVGGNKIKDKTKLLQSFLSENYKTTPSSILIGGAVAYTFLKAQNFDVGKSLVEDDLINFAKNFMQQAKEKNVKILLPTDNLVVKSMFAEQGKIYPVTQIPDDGIGVDIGPETIKNFESVIKKAQTIFANGSMGIYSNNFYKNGSQKILQAVADSSAFTVLGGGDCVAAASLFNLQDKFSFLSTGGGATLTYLSCDDPFQELEGLKVILC